MLIDALAELLKEKSFESISIQDITSRATLNRATFYLHYNDKSTLLRALTEFRFSTMLERRGVVFNGCDGTLQAIALGVCDYLVDTAKGVDELGKPAVETSITQVIAGMFLEGTKSHDPPLESDPALLAATTAWAIFGAAREWFTQPKRIPAEEMARRIETLVAPLFTVKGVRGVEDGDKPHVRRGAYPKKLS